MLPLPPGEGWGEGVLRRPVSEAGPWSCSAGGVPLRSQDPLTPALSPREREKDGLGHLRSRRHRLQSRSRSLMLVLDRVCSSTRFTITAQDSAGPGVPSGKGRPGRVPGTTTE